MSSNTEELRNEIGELGLDGIKLKKFDGGYVLIDKVISQTIVTAITVHFTGNSITQRQ